MAAGPVRQPRIDGNREAARLSLVERDRLVRHRTAVLNQMRDLVLTAPEELRERLRDRSIAGLIAACSSLRSRASDDIETRVRVQSLRRLARRARALTEDAKTVEADLKTLTTTNVPQLLAEPGIGPIVAAQLWVSWSHPGVFAPRPPSPRWPAPARCRPAAGRSPAFGSTVAATGTSTARCIR